MTYATCVYQLESYKLLTYEVGIFTYFERSSNPFMTYNEVNSKKQNKKWKVFLTIKIQPNEPYLLKL